MKTTFRSLILASAVLATAAVATTSAMAENHVNVPFSFAAAGKTCPAGRYSIVRDTNHSFVTLTSDSTPANFKFILQPGDGTPTETKVAVRFHQHDQSYTLESIQYGPQKTRQLNKGWNRTEHQPVEIVAGQ